MPTLQLFNAYSRKDVHAIFSPNTTFTHQAGTWGLQGIVEVPDRPGDYVFLVTFGQKQGDHKFDEFITEDGVLSWQSQPKQSLEERRIRDFIGHKEEINSIYLFLRTSDRALYTYFGRLKYLDHDPVKQNPVHFQWQLIDWPPPVHVLTQLGDKLVSVNGGHSRESVGRVQVELQSPVAEQAKHRLTETSPPARRKAGRKVPSATDRTRTRRPDYVGNQIANQELGLLGELLVLRTEKQRLTDAGLTDLVEKIQHVSVLQNDTAGYDILSFDDDGTPFFLEVKTTRGSIDSDFFISASELTFARAHRAHYRLIRLYDYVDELDTANFFVVHALFDEDQNFVLSPTNYRVSIQRDTTS